MGYKLVPARSSAVPIPEDWQKNHILKTYAEYVNKSKDDNKSESVRDMYEDYAHGFKIAIITLGYEIVEENQPE